MKRQRKAEDVANDLCFKYNLPAPPHRVEVIPNCAIGGDKTETVLVFYTGGHRYSESFARARMGKIQRECAHDARELTPEDPGYDARYAYGITTCTERQGALK